jgi:carbonic anhydrase/acetyltransferase-like protein (isoleucine patch superfamily)
VQEGSLVGIQAVILNGAVIGRNSLVGAGALVTEGKQFEPGSLIVGAPARAVRKLTDEEKQALRVSAAHYAEKAARYAEQLRMLGAS